MPNSRISQLPYVGNTGYTSTDIIPFVNYIDPSGTTSNTTLLEHKSWILSGLSSSYLPLSGGTVFGSTIFTSGVTANTISEVNYINFKTSPTVPNPTGGTLYFDSTENALSYKPVTNQNDVTVNLGQESLIRVYNNLGFTILNGQVLHITGSTSGTPTVALANASKLGETFTDSLAQTSGVATHDIPSGQFGFMTNFGVVRDLNTSAFTAGQEVFLSDTVDGALTNDPNNIAFTSRISTVGYCLESSPTNGKILVVITNENPLQSLTQQEINVLLGNVISTGAYFYTGTTTASTTTINVSPVRGWIVYNTGINATNPLVLNVYYSGGTNLPVSGLTTSFDTYLLVNSGGTLYQTNSYPTPIERRQNIFLCRIVHPNKTTILNVEESVDYDVSPLSSLRDLWVPLKLINENVVPSPNGATLTFRTSSGTFWGNGIGFPTNELNPNSITVPAYLPASFYYTTQTGGTFTTTTTTVDTTKYDVGGVAVNVPGSGNYSTQRIYMSQSGVIRLQYGQNYYSTLAKAIAAIPSETFVVNPDNALDCILIGLLTVKDGTGDLSNTDNAIFTFVSKFGDILGGTGGIATTTLQQAYNNSVPPEILTNSTLGALTIQNGTGNPDSTSNLYEGVNTAGGITSFIRADGLISGSSVSTPGFTANTNGLTANTISATTYQNLPTDIRVTGATYSNNTFTYTNNTGGTFNVNFNTVTGLTINGILLVNGDYIVSGDTIISGTTVYSGDVTYNSNATVGGVLTGAYASPYRQIGSSYTATSVDSTIEVTGGTFTLTLPNANQKIGKQLYIKNDGTGIVTISGSSTGQTIDSFSQRKLARYEELLIQSDGSSNWIILNKKAHTILFGHEWTTGAAPLDTTIYYIGNFLTQQASTTQTPSRQVIAMSSGWATDVSLMVSTATPLGTSEDSTLTLRNVTTATNSTITTTLEHNVASQLLNFTLSSPLQITKGDVLEIQWLTPNWGTNPAAVRHIAQVLLN
jgi:hypothetical protein